MVERYYSTKTRGGGGIHVPVNRVNPPVRWNSAMATGLWCRTWVSVVIATMAWAWVLAYVRGERETIRVRGEREA